MLTLELKLNGRLIGGAMIRNLSNLDAISDYEIEAVETASPETGHKDDFRAKFRLNGHERRQTVWALVAKLADEALSRRKSGEFDQPPVDRESIR